MCLIVFAYDLHPQYRLIVAANRDEFYERPTTAVDWWEDHPQILAGRDNQAGGTWLGIHRSGRWSALTNYREAAPLLKDAPSRGDLVASFLKNDQATETYLKELQASIQTYNGFNLVVDDGEQIGYISNRGQTVEILKPGLYGLSNHLLDTPWPKVRKVKEKLAQLIEQENKLNPAHILSLLHDTELAADEQLPETGIKLEWERLLSAMFIQSPTYGTRVSTVLLIDHQNHITFVEKDIKTEIERSFQFSAEKESINYEL